MTNQLSTMSLFEILRTGVSGSVRSILTFKMALLGIPKPTGDV